MVRINALSVIMSGLFIPICVSFLLLEFDSNAEYCRKNGINNVFCTNCEPLRNNRRQLWQYYLETYSVPQVIDGTNSEKMRSSELLVQMEKYLQRWVKKSSKEALLKGQCANKDPLCVFWASIGECSNNPVFMQNYCVLACQSCDELYAEKSRPYQAVLLNEKCNLVADRQ